MLTSLASIRTWIQPHNRASIDLTMDFEPESQAPGAGLQIVGEKVNLLVNAIEELRQLGLKELDTELPELVLVGDQSAGKSSLMGAIAEINLPKDKGMCTRCPSNIKTFPSRDGTWSCTVSLHEYYSYSHDARRAITKAQPFPPWTDKPGGLEVKPFASISDKTKLEDVLRCAQVALLNPSQDPKSFVPGTGVNASKALDSGYKNEADFSPNIVAIEISGPGLAALSLYDLPGIFASSASPDQKYLIKVFENLATKYIKHENALIICAITMQNDPGLSRTSAIIENLKAEKRCVGVLTMPDRLQEGSIHIDFDRILRRKAHILPRGYFVTKQPGPDFKIRDGADYHAQAREEEALFFNTDPRWTGEWSEFLPRCGTDSFIKSISQMLASQIANRYVQINKINKNLEHPLIPNSLDNIEEKIKAQAHEVDLALSSLPELPDENVQHVVMDRLQKISNGVVNLLAGGPRSNGFLSSWSQLTYDFRNAIESIKPMFSYKHGSDMTRPDREYIDLLDSDDDQAIPVTPTPSRKRPPPDLFNSPHGHQSKKFKPENSFNREPSVATSIQSQQSSTRPKQVPNGCPSSHLKRRTIQPMRGDRSTVFGEFLGFGSGFLSIGDIREIIGRHHPPGFPGHIDHAVYQDICLDAISPWTLLLKRLADHTFKMLRDSVLEILVNFLGDYKQTQLFRSSRGHLLKFLDQYEAEQRQILQTLFDLESYKMFTVNDEIFEMFKTQALKSLQDARRKHRQVCYLQKTPTNKITDPLKVSDIELGPDPFQKEVEVAAYVRGYYKTAGLRFSDNASQSIRGNLFQKVETKIIGMLEHSLELYNGDGNNLIFSFDILAC
jgi:GTPase SAR1 family protein